MNLHRFFLAADSIDLAGGKIMITDRSLVSQIKNVLRLKRGDQIIALDGQGKLYWCSLADLAGKSIEATIIKQDAASGDPVVAVTVALPLLRGGRFEWSLEKQTELGVTTVIPLICQRSVVKPDDFGTKLARWQSIMRESAEQCERASIPTITKPTQFSQLMAELSTGSIAADARLICAERREAPRSSCLLNNLRASLLPPQSVFIAIGPEGGFTPEEIELAIACGVTPVTLGPRIMRSETAAILALAQAIYILSDE